MRKFLLVLLSTLYISANAEIVEICKLDFKSIHYRSTLSLVEGVKSVDVTYSNAKTDELSIRLNYPYEYELYYNFLMEIMQKCVEWSQVAEQNGVTTFAKDMPIQSPNLYVSIRPENKPSCFNSTQAEVRFVMRNGPDSSRVRFTYTILDLRNKYNGAAMSFEVSPAEIISILKSIHPDVIEQKNKELNNELNKNNLFK